MEPELQNTSVPSRPGSAGGRARAAAERRACERALEALADGPVTPSELSRRLGIKAVWQILFRLEDQGLVLRRGDLFMRARFYEPSGANVVLAVVDGGANNADAPKMSAAVENSEAKSRV